MLNRMKGKGVDTAKVLEEMTDATESAVRRNLPPAKNPPPSTSAVEEDEAKPSQGGICHMSLDLNMPNLEPKAVQYAIFEKDPVPAFLAEIKRMQRFNRQELEKEATEAGKEDLRRIQMHISWDRGFKDITGDRLLLLATRSGGIFPAGKKWIVTKVAHIKGKPVCWCIPVEPKRGELINITLDESNTFDLQSAYDKAMQEDSAGVKKEDSTTAKKQDSAETTNKPINKIKKSEGETAGGDKDTENTLDEFKRLYALKEGECLKRVAPPFRLLDWTTSGRLQKDKKRTLRALRM